MTTSGRASPSPPSLALLAAVVFLLFSVWSLSFISIEALLAPRAGAPPRFDWLSLTVGRFVPAAILCGGYCLVAARADSHRILRAHWRRLLVCGALAVPAYNFALYAGQQRAVPAPIASTLTTLAPLLVMLLSAAFLGERLTGRRLLGFAVAALGLVVLARARGGGHAAAASSYPATVALTALAPLSWSIFTVLTKPVVGRISPLVWTYLAIAIGTAPLFALLPAHGASEMRALDPAGWGWLLHLSVLCTVLGFALWSWLLRHLPATSVGFTVFLNPPLTTAYKWALTALFPESFRFEVRPGEALGAAVLLVGVAIAVSRRRKPAGPAVSLVPPGAAGAGREGRRFRPPGA